MNGAYGRFSAPISVICANEPDSAAWARNELWASTVSMPIASKALLMKSR
jgi:hypothetical protein